MKIEKVLSPAMIAELLEMIHNALMIIDADGNIIFTNRRADNMFGMAEGALLGKSFSTLFMPDDVDILVANILSITSVDGEIESEAMFRKGDGSTFLGRISGTHFNWAENREGMFFSIHDISDIKEIENSFKRSERVAFLGRLIDDISHQIRNPIMAIGGLSRRLQLEYGDSRNISIILEEASRLERLLNTLNRFARLPRPVPRQIRICDLVMELETTIGAKVEELGCTWQCRVSDMLLEEKLLIDKDRFFEAIYDVVMNSCESYIPNFNKKKKLVQCEIIPAENDDYPVTLKIIDFGRGIGKQAKEYIFSHFFSDKTGHIGMGLTFARRIIEEQGGILLIESEPGQGTTVSFHLIRERRRTLRTKRIEEAGQLQA